MGCILESPYSNEVSTVPVVSAPYTAAYVQLADGSVRRVNLLDDTPAWSASLWAPGVTFGRMGFDERLRLVVGTTVSAIYTNNIAFDDASSQAISPESAVSSAAVDSSRGAVIRTEGDPDAIRRTLYDGTEAVLGSVVDGSWPNGIGVDPVADKIIYKPQNYAHLIVMNGSGSGHTELTASASGNAFGTNLAIDYAGSILFYDTGSGGMRSHTFGGIITDLTAVHGNSVSGVAVDRISKKVYYVTSGSQLRKCNYDGSGDELVATNVGAVAGGTLCLGYTE